MGKRWYLRLITEGYQLLLAGVVLCLAGAGVVCYLGQLITGHNFLDAGQTAPARMTLVNWSILAVSCVLLFAGSVWFLSNFKDLFFPGGHHEGIVDKIDRVTRTTHRGAGYGVWMLTSGAHVWEVSRHAGCRLSVGSEIRVTYRRGSGIATHIWRRRFHRDAGAGVPAKHHK